MNNQTMAVRYFTKTGNTKKLAEQMADITGCKAETIDKPISNHVDILFLGASVYWGGIDKKVKEFIASLDNNKVGKVAVFSTSAMSERACPEITRLLQEKGIPIVKDDFYCRGQFKLFHRNKPDAEDLKEAKVYAKAVCGECK